MLKLVAIAVITNEKIAINDPNIKVLECPSFLLKKPAENPIKRTEIDLVFAIQLSMMLSTANPVGKTRNWE